MVNIYYSDAKKLFHRNADLNFSSAGGEAYGYVRCDDIELKLRYNSWYVIPAILTATLCWCFGCPVTDAIATEKASFSILDYQGRVVKEIQVEGKGRVSGTFYAFGKDITRHATIKAHKEVLKALNEQILSEKGYITAALEQAMEEGESRRNQARTAVATNHITYNMGLQALATSIDAFAVGVSFSAQKVGILPAVAIIGLTTAVLCCVAILVGKRFGNFLGCRAHLLGGLILAGIGIKSLF